MVDRSSLRKRQTTERSTADSDSDFESSRPVTRSQKQGASVQKRQRTTSKSNKKKAQSDSQVQDKVIAAVDQEIKTSTQSTKSKNTKEKAQSDSQVQDKVIAAVDQESKPNANATKSKNTEKKAQSDSQVQDKVIAVVDEEESKTSTQSTKSKTNATNSKNTEKKAQSDSQVQDKVIAAVDEEESKTSTQSTNPKKNDKEVPSKSEEETTEESDDFNVGAKVDVELTKQTLDPLDHTDLDAPRSEIIVSSSQESVPSITDDDNEDEEEEVDEFEGVDWEAIELPPNYEEMPEPPERVYNDVHLYYKVTRTTIRKSFWEQAYERSVREWSHNAHIVLLVAHYKLRNKWCSSNNIKDVCLSIIPENTRRLLLKDSKERTLVTGIKWLMDWWHKYFTVTGPGLTSKSVSDYDHLLDKDLMAVSAGAGNEGEWDKISDFQDFQRILLELKKGTRDTCAELFVALLRACECETRLVCSLQPISYKVPNSKSKSKQNQEEGKVGESSNSMDTSENNNHDDDDEQEKDEKEEPLFPFRPYMRPSVDYDKVAKSNKAKPPIIWAEVYCTDTKRWICIDPIRKYIDQPLLMEPAPMNKENHLSLVLGIDDQGHCTDVTRRYTLHMERAMRLRERPLTVREKQAGLTLWSDLFLNILCHLRPTKKNRNKMERKQKEEQELDHHKVSNERMPSSLDGFKNHPIYALERHLKRFEVMYPKLPVLGSFKGEKVYPRSSVKTVCTAETWKKLGKVIKTGEVPVKHIVSRAVTLEKKRLKEQAKQQGKELTVPCYGEWQTVSYQSEPVIDGKVPKNGYGNIDLFTAEMLPKGAAHIPIKGIGKIAKQLDIDYADAVVDFEFVKMRSVPVIDGIVVAEEYKDTLLKVWNECELERINKAIAKQERQVNLRWRKLIKGLLIKARIDREYKKEDDTTVTWSNGGGGDYLSGGGGFLPE